LLKKNNFTNNYTVIFVDRARLLEFCMKAKPHELAAVAACLGWRPNGRRRSQLATIIGVMIFNLIGSLLPDIDQASNRLWDMIPGGNTIGKILRRVFIAHRTLSHSLLGIVLFLYFFDWLLPKLFNDGFIETSYLYGR
jgi:membrane-bound metal-dependent hydrolase YbcI (DUF457 family)